MLRIAAVSINHICVRGGFDYALQELRCIHFVCLFVFLILLFCRRFVLLTCKTKMVHQHLRSIITVPANQLKREFFSQRETKQAFFHIKQHPLREINQCDWDACVFCIGEIRKSVGSMRFQNNATTRRKVCNFFCSQCRLNRIQHLEFTALRKYRQST